MSCYIHIRERNIERVNNENLATFSPIFYFGHFLEFWTPKIWCPKLVKTRFVLQS